MELEAKTIIVAAGAIESAKLLLRSISDHWNTGIGNDNDLVGRNLITHPYFNFQAQLPENPDVLMPEMDFPTLVCRHYDSRDEQDEGKFMFIAPPGVPIWVRQGGKSTTDSNFTLAEMMQVGMTHEEIKEKLSGACSIQIQGMVEVFSEENNRIYNLPKRVNHLGMIETKVQFEKPDWFDKRMKEVQAKLQPIVEAMGATDLELSWTSWRADHAACLTRMSDSPDTGVVDKDLKVFGVDNLYICSNASFASLGAVNPTLTLTALSLRLGDHLNELKN